MPETLLDAAGRPRSPATPPGYHAGRSPRNKGPAPPGRPAHRRRDRRRDAPRRHRHPRRPPAGAHRRAVARGCASTKPSRSARATSIRAAARCSCAAARAAGVARSAWMTGLGARPALARSARRAAGRSIAVHRHRPDPRARVVPRRGAHRGAPGAERAGVRRRFAPHQLRHAHAVEMAREGAADRHPAPARPHQPRDQLDLPAGHRQHRDHLRRPRPPPADGPGRPRSASDGVAHRFLVVVRAATRVRPPLVHPPRGAEPMKPTAQALVGGHRDSASPRRSRGARRRV
jgi:hypothetical protein